MKNYGRIESMGALLLHKSKEKKPNGKKTCLVLVESSRIDLES